MIVLLRTALAAEIAELQRDLIGDGWQVISHYVDRTDSVKGIKRIITTEYYADTANVRSAFLIGHVPVPYSGNIYPDGHPNHKGAWPADVYYADMDTVNWTDTLVNTTSASRTANHNVPGDGKFDQDSLPGNQRVELELGRIDLSNLPKFPQTEEQLLAQYFDKDHKFKHKVFTARRRGLIDDRFGWWSEGAFGSCGWRDFSALFGKDSIKTGAYFNVLDTSTFLWTYSCGGGTYTSAHNVGNTDSFVVNQPLTVFNMILGSYFGDWDSQNNYMRAPLASSGWSLASIWSGIPYTHHHHMGMGETMGYTTKVSQNNLNTYMFLEKPTGVHLALMGDPSLRLHILAPPSNVQTNPNGALGKVDVTWTASPDSVLGYHVYRLDTTTNLYNRANTGLVTGTSFTDYNAVNGNNYYMVRAASLENGSGTYYNLSQGVFDTTYFYNTVGTKEIAITNDIRLYPNPISGSLTIQVKGVSNNEVGILYIHNYLGEVCIQNNINGVNQVQLDLTQLPTGLYQVSFATSKTTITKPLAIIR